MIALAELIERFEPALLQRYDDRLLPSQRQALAAMKRCRTRFAPRMLALCEACGEQRSVPHSCGHRACPHCQHHEGQLWLQRQLAAQVPATYFLVTFTLPAELRRLAWSHQRVVYALLMQCAWDTLATFSRNDSQLRATPGAVGVLHTHNRRLDFHPHVHMVMPAAALDPKRKLWRTKTRRTRSRTQAGSGYLFNHKALAKVFRAKVLDAIERAGLVLPDKLPATWVVDCRAVGDGRKALLYLGRYLYRGVIQEAHVRRVQAHAGAAARCRRPAQALARDPSRHCPRRPGPHDALSTHSPPSSKRAAHQRAAPARPRIGRTLRTTPGLHARHPPAAPSTRSPPSPAQCLPLNQPNIFAVPWAPPRRWPPGLSNKRIRSRLRAIYP